MLERITRLVQIGLFHQGAPPDIHFGRTSLIYGENGRGKSTLCAVLDSCGRDRPELIATRATIDTSAPAPAVDLTFSDAPRRAVFANGGWTVTRPEVLVFDSQFVNDNAHAGREITTDQRRGLYEFALGDAVVDRRRLDGLTVAARELSVERGRCERAVDAQAAPMPRQEFLQLAADSDIDAHIELAQRDLRARQNSVSIVTRDDLLELPDVDIDVDAVCTLLRRSLPDIEKQSEQRVREHLDHQGHAALEDWVAEGQRFAVGPDCPFCGQSLELVDLIRCYRDFFNDLYSRLRLDVTEARQRALTGTDERNTRSWIEVVSGNRSRQEVWRDLDDSPAPAIDVDALAAEMVEVHRRLIHLFDKKVMQPLEQIGSNEELSLLREIIELCQSRLRDYNVSILALNEHLLGRKRSIALADQGKLEANLRELEKRKLRHTPAVVEVVTALRAAAAAADRAAIDRDEAREAFRIQQAQTMISYQTAINRRLAQLGAGFTITGAAVVDTAGHPPRTDYRIELRGSQIPSLTYSATQPSVPTVLSDADRRSLALAFFLARLDSDSNLLRKIVVFDDPMTSFDTSRARATISAIGDLVGRCDQIIVLSHDRYFLRKLAKRVNRSATQQCVTRRIILDGAGYAAIAVCDLDDICREEHVELHSKVAGLLAGEHQDERGALQAIRILVENFYKHRFPRNISDHDSLDDIIRKIETAQPLSPLRLLQDKPNVLPSLRELNDYASQYHHSAPGYAEARYDGNELRRYCRGALSLVHDDGQSQPLSRA